LDHNARTAKHGGLVTEGVKGERIAEPESLAAMNPFMCFVQSFFISK
jgi:hypothetical protein